MSASEQYEQMAQFITQVSRLVRDGECEGCHRDGFAENVLCAEHEPWEMPLDDARETVDGLIAEARSLVRRLRMDQEPANL